MVKNFVQKGLSVVVSKQSNIFTAAFLIIITTVVSQILGIFKYRLFASYFGASSDLGVFFASFRIPDLLFQIIIVGALSSSFIPIFSEHLSKRGKRHAFDFASAVMTLGLITFFIITVFVIIFATTLARLIAPEFDANQIELLANLMRIIQLSQFLFLFGTVFTAMLQSFHYFLIPGIANALYNIGIILGVYLFVPRFGIYGAAIGVAVGALFFVLAQLPSVLANGYIPKLKLTMKNGVTKVLSLMLPRSMTIAVTQIAITSNVFFASLISARSIVIFDLAMTLMIAPVILFGQSIAQASFPTLSKLKGNMDEFRNVFKSSFNQILYLTLPISALFIVLRVPLVRLFYGSGRFDWEATLTTGYTLALLSFSISVQAAILLISRAFYALHDTRVPFLITLFAVIINILFSIYFIMFRNLPIYYLALAFSIGNIIGFILMILALDRRISLPKLELFTGATKIAVAAFVTGVALYIPIKLLDQLVFDTTRTINLFVLTGIASGAGLSAYLFFTWLFDIEEVNYIIAAVRRFKFRSKIARQIRELITSESKLNP